MRIPDATYRLQFHKDFGFGAAVELVGYLHELGISDIYASPIFTARAGSMHGYDVVDHSRIDAAIGGAEGFAALSAAAQARGMGMILDIVPNHMGIGETGNTWWMDVLENGPSSSFANYFDIDWHPANPHLENKVLLPILEDQYGIVLEDGKLRLAYEDGAFCLYYYDTRLPIAPRTYGAILAGELDRLTETLGKEHDQVLEFHSILTAIGHLPLRTEADPEKLEERRREKEIIKRRLAALSQASVEVQELIDQAVRQINGQVGAPESFDALDRLIESQPYRLAFWRVAGDEINYRRFFDINELAAIRTEAPEVFRATHQLIAELLAGGHVTGLRVDHPDGLRDPAGYFRQLQENLLPVDGAPMRGTAGAPPLYVVAEKILSPGESLPSDWQVAGTTGYDFLNQVNGLFVRRASRAAFDKIYFDFIGVKMSYRELVNSRKKMIMLISLASEINSLSHRLDDISERNRHYRDFTLNSLTFAIREVIACLAVYRTYADETKGEMAERDVKFIDAAVADAKRRNPRTARAIFDFIGDTLALKNLNRFQPQDRQAVVDFVMKCQQLTGPVMAKGVEDTSYYIYNRLISLNEVGGEPQEFGSTLEHFHRHNRDRLQHWPHSMLTLSTHDTKRGEDARARINALSEDAPAWRAALLRWTKLNEAKKTAVDGAPAPDRNDEYLFYQTLVGAWPGGSVTGEDLTEFRRRIAAYMQKAIKEAKVHTSWINPNEAYDSAVAGFVEQVLGVVSGAEFINDLSQFHGRVAYIGMINSLAQTLLKLSVPGVPDFYQGTELWDFSLVDPDNRRPVDFTKRQRVLDALKGGAPSDRTSLVCDLLTNWQDGRVKQYLIYQTLNFRRQQAGLFQSGSYEPLVATGNFRENLCAFARRLEDRWLIAAVPRLIARMLTPGQPTLDAARWDDGVLLMPRHAPDVWRNVLTGERLSACTVKGRQKGLSLAQLFKTFPVALVQCE